MADTEGLAELKQRIIDDPSSVLNDREIMRALITAGDDVVDPNVIDLRSVAIRKLEERLDDFLQTTADVHELRDIVKRQLPHISSQ